MLLELYSLHDFSKLITISNLSLVIPSTPAIWSQSQPQKAWLAGGGRLVYSFEYHGGCRLSVDISLMIYAVAVCIRRTRSRMPSFNIQHCRWISVVALQFEKTRNVRNDYTYNVGYIAPTKLWTSWIHHIYSDRRNTRCRRHHRQQPRFRRLLEG